ncbi:MAG TPA: bacteriohopanetetrol glucosamine biosynthesis glycosyltransferase HpnI [Xanthobacteraceae bacterium]|nr:bacteriohopanetetrol glucosamine biosynthesis glycosyltransferase HpnI [Xanthobacteraceae bacterium]
MSSISHLVGPLASLCVAVAGLGCLYLLVGCVALSTFAARRRLTPCTPVPVTILKPLHGAEPCLSRRLSSFCRQEYGAPVQVICGARDPADPAVAIARLLAASPEAPQFDLVVDERANGSNPKISNLINMLPAARHDVLVMADSDMEVGPDYLAKVVAELQRPGVGAVTCLYHGVPLSGRWSSHAALGVTAHFLPNVVTAVTLRLARPCFGSTIAINRGLLSRIGGLAAFADHLADDYEIGEAVRGAGLEVAIPAFTVGHACFHERFRGLFAHELRAARTVRSIAPIGYAGAFLTHPFPLALAGAVLGGEYALVTAAAALACRLALCICAERAFGLPRQPYWLIPSRDLLSFGVYIWSFFGMRVQWRGSRYRVAADGSLLSDRREAQA